MVSVRPVGSEQIVKICHSRDLARGLPDARRRQASGSVPTDCTLRDSDVRISVNYQYQALSDEEVSSFIHVS